MSIFSSVLLPWYWRGADASDDVLGEGTDDYLMGRHRPACRVIVKPEQHAGCLLSMSLGICLFTGSNPQLPPGELLLASKKNHRHPDRERFQEYD